MNSHMGSKVEIQWKTLSTAFERTLGKSERERNFHFSLISKKKQNPNPYLKWLLSSMHQLVALQFAWFHKRFATFGTDMHPWTMGVQMFTHCTIIAKHFETSPMWTGYGAFIFHQWFTSFTIATKQNTKENHLNQFLTNSNILCKFRQPFLIIWLNWLLFIFIFGKTIQLAYVGDIDLIFVH